MNETDYSFILELEYYSNYYVTGILLGALCTLGAIGNTITLLVLNLTNEMRQQSINMYLSVLAIYDNGVLLNAILMLSAPALYSAGRGKEPSSHLNVTSGPVCGNVSERTEDMNECWYTESESWFFNETIDYNTNQNDTMQDNFNGNPMELYIQIVYPLALISQTGSIWTTCLITVERFMAVCYPLQAMSLSTKGRATLALFWTSFCAVLYNIPRFFEIRIVNHNIVRSALRENEMYILIYHICLYLTVIYIVPLVVLSYLNVRIYLTIRAAGMNRGNLTRSQQSELNVASMLVLLVAIFIACNAPAFLVNCLELAKVSDHYLKIASCFSNLLVCFNSSVNFVIYCTCGKKFRSRLKETLLCTRNKKRHRASTRTLFGTSFVGETYV